jgi:hypothetical protein
VPLIESLRINVTLVNVDFNRVDARRDGVGTKEADHGPTSAASSTSARRSVRSCVIDAMLLLGERPNAKCPALGGRAGHWAHSDLASMRWTERLDSLHTHRSPDLNRGGDHMDGVLYRLKPLMPSPAMGV